MSLVFSGCLGLFEDDPEVDDGDDGTGTDGGNGNQTADGNQTDDGDKTDDGNGNGGDNTSAEPPEASLSANVTSGSAPLSVKFELDNENPEAESVSWSLDLGEGDPETGDELPATVEHTYEDVGNYTVVLTLTSGDEEDTAEVTITVEEVDGDFPVILEGSTTVPHPIMWTSPVGALNCVSFVTGVGGVDCEFFEIEESWTGHAFTSDAGEGDVDMEFRSDCEPTGESVEMFGSDGHEEGTVPDGAGCVVVANFNGTGSFTVTIA